MRILITGAGFSKAWGLPLTCELADSMLKTLAAMPAGGRGEIVAHITKFLIELQRVKGKEPDLEDILTTLREGMDEDYQPGWEQGASDVWDRLGLDPRNLWKPTFFPVADPAYHYYALQWGLAATLNWNGWAAPPEGLQRVWFGIPQAYAKLLDEHGPYDAVITLNYDAIPEFMFYGGIDYGLQEGQILDVLDHVAHHHRAANGQWVSQAIAEPRTCFPDGALVLKLHGSVNMAYCPTCAKVLLYPRRLPGDREPAEQMAWLATAAYNCTIHCGEINELAPSLSPGRMQPLMVPPVSNKEELPQWEFLQPIQQRAVEIASVATAATIVGTSLRASDAALTQVVKALACPVTLIGGADARGRLQELGITATHLRDRLDETEEDRIELVRNRRPVVMKNVARSEDLGHTGAVEGLDREAWLQLPTIEADKTYLALRMGCRFEQGKPRNVLGHLPTLDVLEGEEERRLRIPEELREWVMIRVALAFAGARDIPGRVRFTRTNNVWLGHVYGP